MIALIYVTQPTGAPIRAKPSIDPEQPHIVQLASMVVDVERREEIWRDSCLVKPNRWGMPQKVLDDIGVTREMCWSGSYEGEVVNGFYVNWKGCDVRVSYGEPFHSRIIRIALKRYMADTVVSEWKAQKDSAVCAMRKSTNVLKLPQTVGSGKYKFPKLGEAYQYFTGKTLPDNSSIDERLDACRDIYFGLLEIDA